MVSLRVARLCVRISRGQYRVDVVGSGSTAVEMKQFGLVSKVSLFCALAPERFLASYDYDTVSTFRLRGSRIEVCLRRRRVRI